jgi:hypothetical protein
LLSPPHPCFLSKPSPINVSYQPHLSICTHFRQETSTRVLVISFDTTVNIGRMTDWSLDDLSDCLHDLNFRASYTDVSQNTRYTSFISSHIDSIDEILRPINLKIHDHPELNYEEYIAHEALTSFLRTRSGWNVTSSAYGVATAFVAEFDSGREGPTVSFNAEYGTCCLSNMKELPRDSKA